MTRGLRPLYAGAVAAVIVALITPHGAAASGEWTLIGAVCADGDLSGLGPQYAQKLMEAARVGGWTLALQIDNGEQSPTRRLVRGGSDATVVEQPGAAAANMGDATTIAELLSWAAREAPAERYALIVFGHGLSPTGISSEGGQVAEGAAVAVDAASGGDPLTPAELAAAIHDGLGRQVDIAVLDCCYGGSAELAWALREQVQVIVAAPGRVPSSGLAWDEMLASGADAVDAAELSRRWLEGSGEWPLMALRPSGLEQVAEAATALSRATVLQMAETAPWLSAAQASAQNGERAEEMCDLREFSRVLAENCPGAVGAAAKDVVEALDRCMVAASGAYRNRIGPAIPVASALGAGPGALALGGEFARSSGWDELVRAYQDRMDHLMRRTTREQSRGADAA